MLNACCGCLEGYFAHSNRSGVRRKVLEGEKENFRWSSGSALKKEQVHFEYHIMCVNRMRRGRGLFLYLSLRYYKHFLLPCGSGRSWDALSQAASVVPALLCQVSCFVSLSYFSSFLYCCFFLIPFLLKQTRIKGRVYHSLPLGMVDL